MQSRLQYRHVLLALLAACGDSGPRRSAADNAPAARAAMVAERARTTETQIASVASFTAAQKLIRSAEMRIQVKDVRAAVQLADSIARTHGGMLADNQLSQDAQDRHESQLVLRVPSDRFAETVAALGQLGEVKTEAVKTQDITREYADLATRLAVKEQTVARLRTLLDTRTAKLADVLEVERELARSVTELEQQKGEQRFWDRQVAMSSIAVTFEERAAPRGLQISGPVASAFRSSLQVLGNSLAGAIYVVTFLLPWGMLAVATWWIVTQVRKRLRS